MSSIPARLGQLLRAHPYGAAATLLCTATYLLLFSSYYQVQPGGSDSFYIYLVSRSLAFDFDLDFTNDYQICGDPQHHAYDVGTGRPTNFYYTGPGFVLVPLLWLARLVVRLPPNASPAVAAGCTGSYVTFVMACVPLLGGLVVYLCYRAARRVADDAAAGIAAGLFGLTTPLIAYSSTLPAFSHLYAALYISGLVLASYRAHEQPTALGRWAVASCFVVAATLTRGPALLYGAVPLVLLLVARVRMPPARFFATLAILFCGGAFALACQLLINRYMFGGWFVSLTGRHYFYFKQPHPLLMLFGIKGGLFYHSPSVWIAVVGFVLLLRRRPRHWPLYVPLTVAALTQVYLYSATIGWHSFGTWGSRKLTHLIPLFTVCGAFAISVFRSWLGASQKRWTAALAIAVAAPIAFTYTGTVYGMRRHVININHAESQADFFGEGTRQAWDFLDERVGPVAVLPAAALFSLRYGLPMTAYRAATDPQYWYTRVTRAVSMKFKRDTLPFGSKRLQQTIAGGSVSKKGLELPRGETARVVFTAEWPFLTHIVVHGRAKGRCTVSISRGGWFTDVQYGASPLEKGKRAVISVPPGAFGNGVNEFKLSVTGDRCRSALLRELELQDRTEYPPPFDGQKRFKF